MDKPETHDELIWSGPEPKQRGRKPLRQTAMSAVERKRRSRDIARDRGEREFLVKVNGLHLEYLDAMAKAQQISTAAALREILDASLDRFVGVMRRSEDMISQGAGEAEVAQFIKDNLYPPLTPFQKGGEES